MKHLENYRLETTIRVQTRLLPRGEGLGKADLVPILSRNRIATDGELPDEVSEVARLVWLVIC